MHYISRMTSLFTVLFLLCSMSMAQVQAPPKKDTITKINAVKAFVKKHHFDEFQAIRSWAKGSFVADAPSITPRMARALSLLEKLHGKLLEEGTLKKPESITKIEKARDFYRQVNANLPRPEEVAVAPAPVEEASPEPQPEKTSAKNSPDRDRFFASFSYFRYNEKAEVKSTLASQSVEGTFAGYTLGIGHHWERMERIWGLRGELLIANGDISSSSLNYSQKSAATLGFIISPSYGFRFTDTWSLHAGLPIIFRSLSATEEEGLTVGLESSLIFGPEALVTADLGESFQLTGGLAFIQSDLSLRVGLNYHF